MRLMTQGLQVIALATLVVTGASSAHAQTVYNSGSPNGASAYYIGSNTAYANDFTLSTTTNIAGVTFSSEYLTASDVLP